MRFLSNASRGEVCKGSGTEIIIDFHEALPVRFHSTNNWLGTWNKKRPITFPSNYYKHYGGKFPYFEML